LASSRVPVVPKLCVTVPCKGRLDFLKRTAPAIVGQADVRYCLVDYDCPDDCGGWIERAFPEEIASGRLTVERVAPRPHFNKGAAHNIGARRLIRDGAEHVCFLDADTVCHPGFVDWLRAHLVPDRFLISGLTPTGAEHPGLVGFLVVPAPLFAASGGFDEWFEEWGGEDLEYRLRLHLEHGARYDEVPLSLFDEIPHGDDLRIRFRKLASPDASNRLNLVYWARKLRRRTGKSLVDLDAVAQRLFDRIPRRNVGPVSR
jgi:hypothetical protein